MDKKNKKKLIILLITTIIVGGLLIFSIIFGSSGLFDGESKSLVKSETVYVIVALMVLLPIFLFSLAFVVAKKRKIKIIQKAKLDIDNVKRLKTKAKIKAGATNGVGAGENITKEDKEEEEKEENPKERFCMLSEIDKKMAGKKEIKGEEISFKELCERFRNFCASELKLYYSIQDIRKFIAGMCVSHILIMQGMSGTGKTSLAFAFGEFLGNSSTIVPIQPMWKERTDLVGYYNEFTGKFNETLLLEKMYEANYSKEIYITVLDEMNIARVEYYFAEFLSLLEIPKEEGRYIDVVADKREGDPKLLKEGRLKLPKNMWYIGTANNDDSTFAISDKVYDRAMIMNLDKKTQPFSAEKTKGVKISIDEWERRVLDAKRIYGMTGRNKRRIRELDKYMIDNFHITFGNRIMKQIKEYVPIYVACGGEELEAIDDIITKKIMRKLETQNPVYVRKAIGGLVEEINEIFGENEMINCIEYLTHLEKVI